MLRKPIMKRYDSYKDSGSAWIGEIPSHWEVKPLKYTADLYNGDSLNTEEKKEYSECNDGDSLPYIASKDIERGSGKVEYENGMRIPKKGEGFSIAKTYSTLLCIEGGSAGKKVAFINQEVCFVNKLCCFDTRLDKKYNYYFICSEAFKEPFFQNLQGMIGGVTMSEIKNFPISVPPVSEQKAIADYLDKKCASIDKIIETQEKRVNLLNELKQTIITEAVTKGTDPNVRYKDSGIEWIGKIPEHWEIRRLKYWLKGQLKYGANEAPDNIDDSHPRYIRITDIDENGDLREETRSTLSPHKAEEYIVDKEDLLFARSGGTVGKAYIHNNDEKSCFAGYLIQARPNLSIANSKFIYLYTKSICYDNWKNSINIQSTIQNIGADKYANLSVPFPPINEQIAIVNYIMLKINPIDAYISKAQKEIDLLREYKQSIITDAVTGKIKVC